MTKAENELLRLVTGDGSEWLNDCADLKAARAAVFAERMGPGVRGRWVEARVAWAVAIVAKRKALEELNLPDRFSPPPEWQLDVSARLRELEIEE